MNIFNIIKKEKVIRDKFKDKTYFKTYIRMENKRIRKLSKKISNNEVKEEQLKSVERHLFNTQFHLIIAKYSIGYKLEFLKNEMSELLKKWNGLIENSYDENLNIIAFAYLLGIKDINLIIAEKQIKKDWLIHYILDSNNTNKDEENINKKYDIIKNIVYKDDKSKYLKEYFEKWYEMNNDAWWYDSHKCDKVNIYVGYWCFEIGAIIKILGLDDEMFKENEYYPYDLVHFNYK